MAKVSVIIPVYNVEEYLRECLDSVINQTLKDIEIICVNDYSTDNSLSILEEYAKNDSRIKIIKHDKNKGLGPARNTGINNANSEYIFFLDSDDYLKLDIIEKLHNKIIESNSDIVFSQMIAFTELTDKKIVKRVNKLNEYLDTSLQKDFQVTTDNFVDTIDNINCVAWGKLYSKNFLLRNKIFFIDGKFIHEDNGFWLKICSNSPKVSFIGDFGVFYRIRENALTTTIDRKKNRNKKQKHMRLILNDVFEYFRTALSKKKQEFYISSIKNSLEYSKFFHLSIGFIFEFSWFKNDKCVRILGIPLFREKLKNRTKKIRKILGITF